MKIFPPCWKDIAFYFGGCLGFLLKKINTEIRRYHIGELLFRISGSADKNRGLCEALQTIQNYFAPE